MEARSECASSIK